MDTQATAEWNPFADLPTASPEREVHAIPEDPTATVGFCRQGAMDFGAIAEQAAAPVATPARGKAPVAVVSSDSASPKPLCDAVAVASDSAIPKALCDAVAPASDSAIPQAIPDAVAPASDSAIPEALPDAVASDSAPPKPRRDAVEAQSDQ